MTTLLGLLVLCFCVVIGSSYRNIRDFLIKQEYYRNVLLSAFYIFCFCVCAVRVFGYVYLSAAYFVSGYSAPTNLFLGLDIVSNTLMVFIGIVLVLKLANVTFTFKRNVGQRQTIPSIPLLLSLTLMAATAAVATVVIVDFGASYYVLGGLDFVVCFGLFASLFIMYSAMAPYPRLRYFEGKKIAQNFVRIFGLSFFLLTVSNILKSVYFTTGLLLIV